MLVTVLGDIGPWADSLFLAGGLAPRYLVGELPQGARPHVGTTDVDFIITLTVGDSGAYRTLVNNLKRADFKPGDGSYQWRRSVDDATIVVEFLCETDEVPRGRIHMPRQDQGSSFGALNVEGAELAARDFVTRKISAERLDAGGLSEVEVQVANLLPYVVLKIQSFQDRHERKDAYDLVFVIANWPGGPAAAGEAARSSPVVGEEIVGRSIELLTERFARIDNDGPTAYAEFLARDDSEQDGYRQEAVAVVRQFTQAFRGIERLGDAMTSHEL